MIGETEASATDATTAAPPRPRVSPEPATSELDGLVACVITELREFRTSITSLAALEWQRLRVRAIDALFRAALLVVLLASATAVAIAAAVLVVVGARDALAAWVGVEWAGEFGAGALILIGLGIGGATLRSVVRRRILAEAVRPRAS